MGLVFSGLSCLVIEGADYDAGALVVRASTPSVPVTRPGCAVQTSRVHSFFHRQIADVPVDGRRMLTRLRTRRMRCPSRECPRQTFREQLAGVVERYQRRTVQLTRQVGDIVRKLARRAGVRVLAGCGVAVSRQTALQALLKLPLPASAAPRVIGVDDFALPHRYATMIINAETGERVDVLADRTAETLEAWLREYPGVEVVCRDGSGAYAEAIRRALPDAIQVGDRWQCAMRRLCCIPGQAGKNSEGGSWVR